MSRVVVEHLEAAVEGGGTDVLVEVVGDEQGQHRLAHVSTTAEDGTAIVTAEDCRKLEKLFGDAAASIENGG